MSKKVPVLAPRIQSTRGQRIIRFVEKYLPVPEGMLVGQPMKLLPEQTDYIHAVYDNVDPAGRLITRRGVFSVARKNGKSGLIASLVGAHTIGPEARTNSHLYSAARSRDQAALVFRYLAKSLRMNKGLQGLVEIVDSSHVVRGLLMGTEYKAISADATNAFGLSPALTVHDELGQVLGPQDRLYDALESAGGAHEEPLSHIISTQAAGDADLLSTIIDDGIRSPTPETVVRLYAADKDADIYDEKVWFKVNFAMGKFRNEVEFREYANKAKRMPGFEASFKNLYLNQRISLLQLFVAPSVWRDNNRTVDNEIFTSGLPVHAAADLSQSKDLTVVAFACEDPQDKTVHLRLRVYTPAYALDVRAQLDRIPYPLLAEQGWLTVLPGRTVDYDMVAQDLKEFTAGMNIEAFHFDRWRMDMFRKACLNNDYLVVQDDWDDTRKESDKFWRKVGQGYRDMSPRLDYFESVLLNERLAHGQNPLLNAAVATAVVVLDPQKNRKLEKARSAARIDPLVAAVMAVAGFADYVEEDENTEMDESSFQIV